MEFVYIIVQVMLPVFAILGIGAWLHRAFQFDLHTLGKMNMYFIIPAFTFENLYKVQFSMDLLLHVLLFFGVFITALYVYALCVALGGKVEKTGADLLFTQPHVL